MSAAQFQYLYGPVPSRRLGRSLGVDLVPYKTCTYDCIYCQLGRTTRKTVERRQYVPVRDIIDELRIKLASEPAPDFISIAGSGEPTLNSYIGELIGMIKNMTEIPVAVLTNGSLLFLPEVRQGLMQADLVIPSLDAGDERLFRYVNRPHDSLSFERMLEGLCDFTRQFPGDVWLEVFLLSGVTGMASEVEKISRYAKKIKARKIQLNTVSRPTYEDFACAVDRRQLGSLAGFFDGVVDVLDDGDAMDAPPSSGREMTDPDILALLSRRPCTLAGICSGLGLHPQEAAKKLKGLVEQRRVTTTRTGRDVFYQTVEQGK